MRRHQSTIHFSGTWNSNDDFELQVLDLFEKRQSVNFPKTSENWHGVSTHQNRTECASEDIDLESLYELSDHFCALISTDLPHNVSSKISRKATSCSSDYNGEFLSMEQKPFKSVFYTDIKSL